MKLDLELPSNPGVYRFYNKEGEIIYIGKAKNLSRRISQYRNARRCKAHAKMRKIRKEAAWLEFEICESEIHALRLENHLIQEHRPKWNVAGAFYFLYPMIGIRIGTGDQAGQFFVCYTTQPLNYPGFEFHGAFRSRLRTKTAFFSLIELLRMIGHAIPRGQIQKTGLIGPPKKFEYAYGFRQVPIDWMPLLDPFLSGDHFLAVEELALLLLEKPGALARSSETQEHLRELRSFWRHEILPLKRAREHSLHPNYPVAQRDRDALFISLKSD
jgi:hypothetical protein